MKKASFLEEIVFNDSRPAIKLIVESKFSKEIRIAFNANQVMKEHQTAYPIVVQIIKGEIAFGVKGEILTLKEGDMIALEGNVPHDLKANKESIVRLTLSKLDKVARVESVTH
ncbi:cupin domain-containing protein [Aureispira anguillae]|uniref:Cupin domain-containing protein n=1 Tax=Aureispira anguillae TaxID=2864201 RepID=A0A915YIG2_9BACT|nr:cupin domain-containing protein [Aureispira anguillae]BDS13597.1 cupin domain-containing protein [Aureispira anguillae]